MQLWMDLGVYALFEFNWNSSAESYVNSTSNTNVESAQKHVNYFQFPSGIYFLDFQRNKNFAYWSSFLKLGKCYQKKPIINFSRNS